MDFRPIPDFESYEISRSGVVRRCVADRGARVGHVIAQHAGIVKIPSVKGKRIDRSVAALVANVFGVPDEFRRIPGFDYDINRAGVLRKRNLTGATRVVRHRRPGGYFLTPIGAPRNIWRRTVELIAAAFDLSIRDVLSIDDLPGEEWRPVIGFEDLYDVSNMGRVRRMAGGTTYIGRIIKPVLQKKQNRYHVNLSRDGVTHQLIPGRLVCTAFLGQPEPTWQANHENGDTLNDRLDNLNWKTPAGNSEHAYRTGLSRPVNGSRHGSAKLNEDRVREIRSTPDVTDKQFARQFSVSASVISEARRGITWKHI